MRGLVGRASFWENILASLVATAVVAGFAALVAGRLDTSSSWFGPVAGALVSVLVVTAALTVSRRRHVPFTTYMTKAELARRIDAAEREIWSFQISGGEFTQTADRLYERWLLADGSRRLKVLFANPDNYGLLQGIIKLSGMAATSSEQSALTYLRDTILTSLDRYAALADRCPGQVELRVYDGSPPCSIHAVDVIGGATDRGSIFVENYLPSTGWVDRPCYMLRSHHRPFALYVRQCRSWFQGATRYRASPAQPVPAGTAGPNDAGGEPAPPSP